jgi:hypothetical protein
LSGGNCRKVARAGSSVLNMTTWSYQIISLPVKF